MAWPPFRLRLLSGCHMPLNLFASRHTGLEGSPDLGHYLTACYGLKSPSAYKAIFFEPVYRPVEPGFVQGRQMCLDDPFLTRQAAACTETAVSLIKVMHKFLYYV